jgi:hypothetical protein
MSGGKNEIALQNTAAILAAMRSQITGAYVLQKFIKPRGFHATIYRLNSETPTLWSNFNLDWRITLAYSIVFNVSVRRGGAKGPPQL